MSRFAGKTPHGIVAGYCEYDGVENLSKHLDKAYKEGKGHEKYRLCVVGAQEQLKEKGWKLAHEGIRLAKLQYHCEPCGKKAPWYEVFDSHIDTNAHRKARRGKGMADPPASGSEAERRAWKLLFTKVEDPNSWAHAAADPDAAVPSPPQKRAKPSQATSSSGGVWALAHSSSPSSYVAASSAAASAAGRAAGSDAGSGARTQGPYGGPAAQPTTQPSSLQSTAAPRVPEGMEAEPAPSAEAIDEAQSKTTALWYPTPSHESLVWGKYVKKKGACLWCTSCLMWDGWANLNVTSSPPKSEVDPDGRCAHYTADVKHGLHEEMRKLVRKWAR